jgi:endonuclease/exonuclease/phosphatase family metal-dependent hydrolase
MNRPSLPSSVNLKVLTYNIHKGFSPGNSSYILEPMREAIRGVDPDLVFLQEILGEHRKHQKKISGWPEDSQFDFLAETVWPHSAYGKNAIYTHGHHGNAILSKFPIAHWENIDVSSNRLESRGILHGAMKIPHSTHLLHFFCLHLNLLERSRKAQVQILCDRINARVPSECPLIICGDFNDWRGRATAMLEQQTGVREAFQTFQSSHARSFPSKYPLLTLDRCYFRGITVENATVLNGPPWNSLSDHLPLMCEFSIRATK